jgi:hypothetical protein
MNQILGFVNLGKVGAFPLENGLAKHFAKIFFGRKSGRLPGSYDEIGLPRFFEKTFLFCSPQYLIFSTRAQEGKNRY